MYVGLSTVRESQQTLIRTDDLLDWSPLVMKVPVTPGTERDQIVVAVIKLLERL